MVAAPTPCCLPQVLSLSKGRGFGAGNATRTARSGCRPFDKLRTRGLGERYDDSTASGSTPSRTGSSNTSANQRHANPIASAVGVCPVS